MTICGFRFDFRFGFDVPDADMAGRSFGRFWRQLPAVVAYISQEVAQCATKSAISIPVIEKQAPLPHIGGTKENTTDRKRE